MGQNNNNNNFCDWLRASQQHMGKIKKLHDGFCVHADKNGIIETYTEKSLKHEGSYSTSIMIRSINNRVSISGNIGRFNRQDNLFNYDLDQTKQLTNNILQEIGLPSFTDGELYETEYKNKQGEIIQKTCTTGATIGEIHYTTNYATGSPENAKQYIYSAGIININRQNVRAYKTGATYGEGSRFKSSKIYNKAEDIKHWTKKGKLPDSYYNQELIKYCYAKGVIRFETQFRNVLIREGLNFWKTATHQRLNEYFNQELELMTQDTEQLDIKNLPLEIVKTYAMYKAGLNVRQFMSKTAFYRHRAILKDYGIDIKETLNIIHLPVKQRVITLEPLQKPDWYQLPSIQAK